MTAPSAHDLENRTGFDPSFLGVDVPMPGLTTDVPTMTLPYTHYSVLFRPDRRTAAVTALDLDGQRLLPLARSDAWQFDPRLAPELQIGPAVYAHNDLDRGHLVMRASSTWGDTPEEAHVAEVDTFFFTNAAPQASLFNQGRELWLGLEDYLMENAATYDRRLVVFAGPVLDPADPVYRGVQVPLRFWKVAGFLQDGVLAATGYLLDQSPLVENLPQELVEAMAAGAIPPLGPFRTFQLRISQIADLTGVQLDQLAAVDLMPIEPTLDGGPPPWRELTSFADIQLAA